MKDQIISKSKLCDEISCCQRELGINDEQLSSRTKMPPKMMQLVFSGLCLFPTSYIPVFSETLGIDSKHLLRLHLSDTDPQLLNLLDSYWPELMLTSAERKLITAYRVLAKENDVEPVIMDGANIVALISV